MIKYLYFFLCLIVIMLPTAPRASVSVTLPYSLTFDDNSWVSDLALTECGGTSTHVTSGCYSGGCMKVTPPTSACTGGGINGGQTGLGWVTYSGTSELHVRFLIKFGSTYATNVTNGGGGLINKFLDQLSPSRSGILGLQTSDSDGRFMAFGVTDMTTGAYIFRTPPNRGWIEDSLFRISSTVHVDEWIVLEYWINQTTGKTGLYIWTQDGTFSGAAIENVTTTTGISQQGFYLSYFNCYGTADANNYYLMDNLQVSSSYIGPPTGFLEGDEVAPTISSVSSSKANGSYKAGEVIDIDVTFSENVTSTGNVTVTLETGDTDRTCTFTVTDSNTGTCNYTVQAGDVSADLQATISGTIADQASNAMSNFAPTTNLAANKALVIDTTAPTVDAFTVPATSATRLVTSSTFTCTGATGYIMNESAEAPLASADGWTDTAPTSYTFGSDGEKTLYGWCKDAASNVSTSVSDTVTVTTGTVIYFPCIIQ